LRRPAIKHGKPVSTPVDTRIKLVLRNDENEVDSTIYKQVVGSTKKYNLSIETNTHISLMLKIYTSATCFSLDDPSL